MDVNRFAKLDFSKGFIKRGSKVSEGAEPVLRFSTNYNSFTLNEKGMKLIGLQEGDTVVMFDMADDGATSNSLDRFYVAAGKEFVDKNGVPMGAKIGAGNSYAYSKIYGAALATAKDVLDNEMEITEITPKELIAKGLLVEGAGTNSYVATQKGIGTLVKVGEDTVEIMGHDVELFVITNISWEEHTPKKVKKD